MLMAGGVGIGAKDLTDGLSGRHIQVLVGNPDFVCQLGILLQWRRCKPKTRRQVGDRAIEELNKQARDDHAGTAVSFYVIPLGWRTIRRIFCVAIKS